MATRKQAQPKITPPYGYGEVAPLQRSHRVLLPAPGSVPDFCHSINSLALSLSEFGLAARDYPIVFASTDAGKAYAPVIVLGLADAQNLFIDAAGAWDGATYLPAFVRRYPFCILKLPVRGKRRSENLACVVSKHLHPQGAELYNASGEPTPRWEAARRLLEEYERDLDATAQMCAYFAELKLFSPFTFQVVYDQAPGLTLQGMHRIDEQKLKELKPASHKALVTRGYMDRIYAHIHSLENFARLYDRAVARVRAQSAGKH